MGLLNFDQQQMQRGYNTLAFPFTHRLQESRLFELDRLAGLAEFLERKGGRRDVYNAAAGTEFSQPFTANGARGLAPDRAINEIESSRSWMVLKRIEQHPDYNEIVQTCLAELSKAVPDFLPGRIVRAEGFIFVTSPRGITPYHIDPQWSFLAQIRGRKTYRIYDVSDPEVISDRELEDYYCGKTMAARHAASKDGKASAFDLTPGMCVNQPLHAPHSAEVGSEYSISFSVAIISDAWAWQSSAYRANRWLRNIGFSPAPVGANPFLDRAKSALYRSSSKFKLRMRGKSVSTTSTK